LTSVLEDRKSYLIIGDYNSAASLMLEAAENSYRYEENTLRPEYQTICVMPFQHRGFFGLKDIFKPEVVREELLQLKEFGVNAIDVGIYMTNAKPSTDGDVMDIDLDEFQRYLDNYERFIDLCNELNISVLVDIVTATNFQFLPEWVYDRYPDVAALDQNNDIVKSFQGNKPWHSVEHPAANIIKTEIIKAVVERFKNKKNIIAWAIDGETFHGTLFYPEHWLDYSEYAIHHYRKWLKKKYRTIDTLNEAWNKTYVSFDEIDPTRSPGRDAESIDWHLYRIRSITEYVSWFYRFYKKLDPTRLLLGFMADVPYRDQELIRAGSSPIDYMSLLDGYSGTIIVRDTDFKHYNSLYRLIVGSFGKPVLASESFLYPPPPSYPEIFRFLYECLGLGVWFIGIGTWDVPLELDWHNKGTQAEPAIRAVYSEVSRMPLEYMWPIKPKIAIYLSELTWIMDGFKSQWENIHASLIESHFPFRYIFSRQILNGEMRNIPVIISVDNEIVNDEVVNKLESYIWGGGNLVVVGKFYEENQNLKATTTPFLDSNESWIPVDESIFYRLIQFGEGKVLQVRAENYTDKVTDIILEFFNLAGIPKPVAIRATLQNGEDVSRSLEVFTLFDGVNLAAVMINLFNLKVQVEVQINAEVCLDTDASYMVRELRTGNILGHFGRKDVFILTIAIEPNSAAVIFAERETTKEEVTSLLNTIEKQLNNLANSGFDTALAEYFRDQARHFLDEKRYSKALACASKALNQLFLKIETSSQDVVVSDLFTATIKVYDSKGMPVENARVIASYMNREILCEDEGDGRYALKIDTSTLDFYNYFGRKYSPITGQIEFSVRAEKDGKYGRTTLPVKILLRDKPVGELRIEAEQQISSPRWSTAIILLKITDGSGVPVGGANVSINLNGKTYQCRNLGDEFYFTAIPTNIVGGTYTIYVKAQYGGLSAESNLTLIVLEPHSSIFNIIVLLVLLICIIFIFYLARVVARTSITLFTIFL